MKTAIRKLLALVLVAALLAPATALTKGDELVETYDLESGKKIEFHLKHGGGIRVIGWDKNKAEVTFADRKRPLDDYNLEVKETSSGLKISAELAVKDRHMYTNLRVTVRVPREVSADFYTAGGSIHLDGVEGNFTGKTMGGEIIINDVQGDLSLKTNGGEIEITDSKVDGKVHTNGGPVLVKDVIGDVRATSNGGNVQYINVRDGERQVHLLRHRYAERIHDGVRPRLTGETVQITSMGGGIEVAKALEGAIVSTGGGEIDIRRADRFVEARTGGGDISIEINSGWVSATTGAGDIELTVDADSEEDGDVTLLTGTGDITVYLPADFSMELDVDLAYTRNSDQDFEIISDFDIDREHTERWDSSNGTPRKHIYGTATIKGGQHKVKIRTVNGDVKIKKKR